MAQVSQVGPTRDCKKRDKKMAGNQLFSSTMCIRPWTFATVRGGLARAASQISSSAETGTHPGFRV